MLSNYFRKKYSSDAANLTSDIAAADVLSDTGLIFSLQVDAPRVAFPMPEFGLIDVSTFSLADLFTSNGSPSVSTTMVQPPDSPRAAVTPIFVADSPSPDAQIESGCCFMCSLTIDYGAGSLAGDSSAMGDIIASFDGIPFESLTAPEDFVTAGGKWGPSGTFGTTGGTVTWSIVGAGASNTTGFEFFSGTTVAMSSFLSFDFTAVLTQAFAAWSAFADVNFVQVADGGGDMGTGLSAMIRIGGGFIDGRPPSGTSVLARAYSPVTAGNAQNFANSGDMVFDSGEGTFWTASSFLAVATHEIGHALGLRHTSVAGSLMEPFYSPSITSPQADDIAGIRTIYGAAAGGSAGLVSINDVTINEGNAGTQTLTFMVTRSGGSAAFSVNFATVNGTASAGSDYIGTLGTLSFASGVNTRTISVTINGDTAVEPNETFFVNLSGATNGAVISDGQGQGTLLNDDSGSVAGTVAINDVSVTEGDAGTKIATFTVTRSGGTAAFTVNFATANNSALAGSDYIATTDTLSFGVGVNTQTISVTINGDRTVELSETFFVNLSGATNGAILTDSQGLGTIVNDDTLTATDDYADSFNDTTAPFGQVIVGGVANGNLETVGDRDWFRIALTANTTVTFDLLGLGSSTGTLPDPFLYLYNGSGVLLAQDDDSGTGFDSRLTFTPTISGTYFVAAASYADGYSGTYRIGVSGPGAPIDDYADSLTDTSAPFGQVSVNGTITGRLEVTGDRDWFRVQLTAGNYIIDLQGLQSGGGTLEDPYLRLHNSAGVLIAENDDIVLGVNRDSRLEVQVLSTGTYYIEIGAWNDNYTGTYSVAVVSTTSSGTTAAQFQAAYARITQNNVLSDAEANALAAGSNFDAWVAMMTNDPAVVHSTGAIILIWDQITGNVTPMMHLRGQVDTIEAQVAGFLARGYSPEVAQSIAYKGIGASLANSPFSGSFAAVWDQNTNTVGGQQAFVQEAFQAIFGRLPTAGEIVSNVAVFETVKAFYAATPVPEATADARAKGEFIADLIKQANDFSIGPNPNLAIFNQLEGAIVALANDLPIPDPISIQDPGANEVFATGFSMRPDLFELI